jgi:hypothetical protein
METVQGNKLIAEFMQRTFQAYNLNKSYDQRFETFAECQDFIIENELEDYYPEIGWKLGMGKYNSSWDWLMPVVEKITAIHSISVTIESFTVENSDKMVGVCKIEKTFWPSHGVCEKELIIYKKEFVDKLPVIQNVWERVTSFIQWYTQSKS